MKEKGKKLLLFQIAFLLFAGLLQDFGAPHAILYLVDVSNLLLLLCVLCSKDYSNLRHARSVLIVIGLWLGYMLITAVVNSTPILLVIWAMRNWARGFVVLLAGLLFLDVEDIRRLGKALFVLYIIQLCILCYQFFTMGYFDGWQYVGYLKQIDPRYIVQDHLGGIFGQANGGNGWNNLFVCTMLLALMCRDYDRGKLAWDTVFVAITSMVVAAVLELKILFYEFIGIQVMLPAVFAIKKRLNKRMFGKMLLCAAISFGIGMWLLSELYPTHFWVIIGKRSFKEYEDISFIAYRISRLKFIPEINALFLPKIRQQLFGLGFGNCEFSSASFFRSAFSVENEQYNYHFFAHQTLYLESGIVGLILFALIPGIAAIEHGIEILRKGNNLGEHAFAFAFAGLMALHILYNNAFRAELSYIVYFVFSISYVLCMKKEKT